MTLLSVEDLKMYYSTVESPVRAVDGVSFDLGHGESLGIVGESGSGKTSLSLSIMRLYPKNSINHSGRVTLDGIDITGLSQNDFQNLIRWRKLSMVFQGAMNSLNPVIRVGQQVAEPLLSQNKPPAAEIKQRVLELFDLVRLPKDVFDRYPHELSGGMKQRAMIAMALVLNPNVVILDEPTSALDVSVQAQMTNIFKELMSDIGISFIFITHDIALASDLCDKIAVMYAGEIIEIGNTENVLLNPQHPYTYRLLQSIPSLDSDEIPQFIPGAPPDMTNPPAGCRFHTRCPVLLDICSRDKPVTSFSEPSHETRCWLLSNP